MEPLYELKPDKTPFLLWRNAWVTLFVAAFAAVFSLFFPALIVWPIAAIIVFFAFISRGARYRKERYTFYEDRVIIRSGGLFSDGKTELVYGRITHVKLTLPWLENTVFGTGTVRIESAGSSGSEAMLQHIPDPQKVYEYTEGILRSSGFSLQKKEMLVKARPHPLAVLFATARSFLSVLVVLFWVVIEFGLAAISAAARALSVFVIPITLLILLAVSLWSFMTYMNLSRRRYFVHDDTITYEEGFLTRRYAFLPAENLSDSATTQTFIDRIFDLYDVRISVQGAGSEIRFSNLREGKQVDAAIDRIIDTHSTPIGKQKTVKKAEKQAAPAQRVEASAAGTYKPVPKRALLPLLLWLPVLIFPPAYLVVAAGYLIRAFTETYEIRSGRVIYNKRFLGTKRVEFTAEKVTQIEFSVGILDRFTNTMTAHVKSIGSGENVTLYAIPDTPEVRQSVLSVDAVTESPATESYPGAFSLWGLLVRFSWIWWILGLATVAVVVVSAVVGFAWVGVLVVFFAILIAAWIGVGQYVRYRRASLTLHKEYVRYSAGWLRTVTHYARFDAVKDVSTTRYWRSDRGDVRINIAGEEVAQQGQNQASTSQHFTAPYLAGAFGVHDAVLRAIGGQPAPKTVLSATPQARNVAVWFVILVPLIVFLPFLLWSYRKRSYRVESDRIVAERGIFSRTRTSVLYGMVDHVRSGQGLFNKLFSNGFVAIYTTGSSSVELVLSSLQEFEAVASAIEEQYR